MTAQTEQLARQFEDANRVFVETVESVSDADWGNLCSAENWSVGVTAHHVGSSYVMAVDVLQSLAAGEARPVTMQMLDQLNAEHAVQHAGCTREETVGLLRAEGENAALAIRGLSDEELDTRHELPFLGEEPVSLEQFIGICFIGHHDAHLPSIREAAPSASRVTLR